MATDTEDTSSIRRPPYKPPPKYTSDKGEDNMYPMTNLGFGESEVQNRYENVLGPLSLFAPYPHEDETKKQEKRKYEEPPVDRIELERPVTPIDDEIKASPSTFNKLADLIRRRIAANPDVPHLGIEDQQALAAVIMGEVNGIWPDLRKQVQDPFLSPEENKELQRRINVHIITVSEKLFRHYIDKAKILNKRGIFSSAANMCRLKAQLALDANKFLNVLMIRRHLVAELRGKTDEEEKASGEFILQQKKKSSDAVAFKSFRGMIEASRPKSSKRHYKIVSPQEALRELNENMPDLETAKLFAMLSDFPQERPESETSIESSVGFGKVTFRKKVIERKSSQDITREKITLKKSLSVPKLNAGETLLEELGIDDSGRNTSATSAAGEAIFRSSSPIEGEKIPDVAKPEVPEMGTREYAADDLRKLMAKPKEEMMEEEDDLPPLLQALTRTAKADEKRKQMEAQLKELEEKEKRRQELESIRVEQPKHAQPATVATTLPNKMVVRTSDIRVSERVCLSSITLKKHSTVYNDLIDEIDAETVKKLDSNLFLSDEITEVYKEIMKTVPKDHMDLENDDMIEPVADSINLSSVLASSTLNKKPSERVINPRLHKEREPPWGDKDIKEWAKTPMNPPKDMKGRTQFDPMIPTHNMADKISGSSQQSPGGAPEMSNIMMDIQSRTYASWLNWWKNTINSDDYMKYLSTQESDYLGLVFHFYNSDDEDDDEEDESPSRITAQSLKLMAEERERKLTDLKSQKSDYRMGYWNANSILLGGLGKDPSLEVDTIDDSPRTLDTSRSQKGRLSRGQLSRTSTKVSSETDGKLNVPLPGPGRSDLGTQRSTSRLTQATSHVGTKKSVAASVEKHTSEQTTEEAPKLTTQERLERIWAMLQMPDGQKLDMAIKYSSDSYYDQLTSALVMFEKATHLVLQREAIIAKLEDFERMASDPNRFFEKGFRGSSVARLEEAKLRSHYYKRIEALDEVVKVALEQLQQNFQDTLTFQGRPYMDKMQWDRTEMLYWLQEERKARALDHESRLKEIPLRFAQLEPLPSENTMQA